MDADARRRVERADLVHQSERRPRLGSAMLAAIGAGLYPDIPAAAENMVHTADTIEPDSERHEEYKFYVDRYMEAYPQMKELMHKTERHVAGAEE